VSNVLVLVAVPLAVVGLLGPVVAGVYLALRLGRRGGTDVAADGAADGA